MFPCCHVQGAVHLFALPLKRLWYQQMSGPDNVPQSCRVRDGGRGREGLMESAATCRASSSVWAVTILMSSPDEDKRAT